MVAIAVGDVHGVAFAVSVSDVRLIIFTTTSHKGGKSGFSIRFAFSRLLSLVPLVSIKSAAR